MTTSHLEPEEPERCGGVRHYVRYGRLRGLSTGWPAHQSRYASQPAVLKIPAPLACYWSFTVGTWRRRETRPTRKMIPRHSWMVDAIAGWCRLRALNFFHHLDDPSGVERRAAAPARADSAWVFAAASRCRPLSNSPLDPPYPARFQQPVAPARDSLAPAANLPSPRRLGPARYDYAFAPLGL